MRRFLKGHQYFVIDAKFINFDDQILSCSYDGSVKLWNVQNGDCLQTFEHSSKNVILKFKFMKKFKN